MFESYIIHGNSFHEDPKIEEGKIKRYENEYICIRINSIFVKTFKDKKEVYFLPVFDKRKDAVKFFDENIEKWREERNEAKKQLPKNFWTIEFIEGKVHPKPIVCDAYWFLYDKAISVRCNENEIASYQNNIWNLEDGFYLSYDSCKQAIDNTSVEDIITSRIVIK